MYFIFPRLIDSSSGINVGVFYAVSTLLSQMVLHYHPAAQESTGAIGLLIVVAGMAGSVVCGLWLDRFHHFKSVFLSSPHFVISYSILYVFQNNYLSRLSVQFCWNGTFHRHVGFGTYLDHLRHCWFSRVSSF